MTDSTLSSIPMLTNAPHLNWKSPKTWILTVLAWTFPALVALSYYYLNQRLISQTINWTYALITTLPNWYLWILMTPMAFFTARKLPLSNNINWFKFAILHLIVMLFLLALQAFGNLLSFRMMGLHDTINAALWQTHLELRAQINILTYFAVVGIYYAYQSFQQFRERERLTTELQFQLTQAQLYALKMQLNPHFLFNALNAVASLVRKNENKQAVQMLGKLGEFLRFVLETKDEQDVPLHQEIAFAQHYLDIEKIRFQDRLKIEFDIESDISHFKIPNLLLQPLVENAIRHGIAPNAEVGQIRIVASRQNDTLAIRIEDNGKGLDTKNDRLGFGIGLENTRTRLQTRFGDAAKLSFEPSSLNGLAVCLTLPIVQN